MSWTDLPNAPAPGTVLCAANDVTETRGRGIDLAGAPKPFRLFIVRRGADVFAYVNACAHFGIELNPGRDHTFLNADGDSIRCQHHGAQYAIEDGRCLKGECDGDGLMAIPVTVRAGHIVIDDG